MATENIGVCADVSARYALQPTKSVRRPTLSSRNGVQLRQKLHAARPSTGGRGGAYPWASRWPSASAAMSGVSSADLFFAMYRQQRELHELATAHADLPVPTTLSGFKKHPKYVLERDFLVNHGIKPGSKSQGLFKGNRYWLRKDLSTLLPIRKWGSLVREIKPEEKDTPAKTLTKKITKDKQQSEYYVHLYGEWQTRPLIIAPIVDDLIPTNEYGKSRSV